MANAQSVKYTVLTGDGDTWAPRGETANMGAAMSAAGKLLESRQAAHVRVVKEFVDAATGRTVNTTILDESVGRRPGPESAAGGGGGVVRWLAIAAGMFAVGFAGVYAARTFFL